MLIVSEVPYPPICELCGSQDTRHVADLEDGILQNCWWRCLGCQMEYGIDPDPKKTYVDPRTGKWVVTLSFRRKF